TAARAPPPRSVDRSAHAPPIRNLDLRWSGLLALGLSTPSPFPARSHAPVVPATFGRLRPSSRRGFAPDHSGGAAPELHRLPGFAPHRKVGTVARAVRRVNDASSARREGRWSGRRGRG